MPPEVHVWSLLLTGCVILSKDVPGDTGFDDFHGITGDYEPFVAATISVDGSDTPLGISLVSTANQTACSLGSDLYAAPVGATQQIVVTVRNFNFQDCPSGLFPLDCTPGTDSSLGSDTCARYREWDATGRQTVSRNATAGSVQITDQGGSCAFELELQFPTGVFQESWTMPTDDPLPWCAP